MPSLALAGLFFVPTHIGVAGTALRDRMVALAGQRGYMVLFLGSGLFGRPEHARSR